MYEKFAYETLFIYELRAGSNLIWNQFYDSWTTS